MRYIKISSNGAKRTSWDYNTSGVTEDEKWLDGNKVQCQVFPFPEQSKTIVIAKIEAGAFHGRTIAKSDYYYSVLLGRGEFFFYQDNKIIETTSVHEGDTIMIPTGTDYDYQAQSQDLQVHLTMNNLWNVGRE